MSQLVYIILALIALPVGLMLLYTAFKLQFIDKPTPAQIAQEEADRKDMERMRKEDEVEEVKRKKREDIEEARVQKELKEYSQQLQRDEDQKKLEREAEAAKKAKDQAKDTDR